MGNYRSTILVLSAALAASRLAGCSGGSGTTGVAGTSGKGGAGGTLATAGTSGGSGTSGGAGTTGAAGTSAPAGAGGSGGTSGASGMAGTSGAAGTGGGTGAAGSTGGGAGGGATGAGATGGAAAGSGGRIGGGGCASLPLCETFESATVGGTPSATTWTIVNGMSNSNGTATIDSMGANGTSKSVKLVVSNRFWLRNSGVTGTLGNAVHVRFFLRFGSAPPANHAAFFATDPQALDQYTDGPQLRLGTQDMVLHWNVSDDAANLPTIGPGDPMSFMPAANKWYCVELTINRMNGHLDVAIDGASQAGLANDGTPTTNVDADWINSTAASKYTTMVEFNLGWASFGAGPMTLWFDEIALSSNAIGCN